MMQKMARYFFRMTADEIRKDKVFSGLYSRHMEDDLEKHMERIYHKEYGLRQVAERLRYNKRKRNQQKKRWVEALVEDYENQSSKKPKELQKYYQSLLIQFQIEKVEDFKIQYGAETPEDAVKMRIQKLYDWMNSSAPLYHFYYFAHKTSKQIESALDLDMLISMGQYLVNNYDGNPNNIIEEIPNFAVSNPIVNSKGGKLLNLSDSPTPLNDAEDVYKTHNYKPEEIEGYTFQTLVKEEYAIENAVRDLDETDFKIFRSILKQRDSRFLTERMIEVNINEIVKEVYKSDNKKNYEAVEKRIIKMANMYFNTINSTTNEKFGFNFFNAYRLKYVNGVRFANLFISEPLYEDYAKLQVVRFYSNKLDTFKSSVSNVLVFALQKDRIFLFNNKQSNTKEFSYSYFLMKMQFPSRTKDENRKTIEESLQEICDAGILIESFKRDGDIFIITFLPVTEYEVEDLLNPSIDMTNQFLEFKETKDTF